MFVELFLLIDKYISMDVILSNIKNFVLVFSLLGKIVCINCCCQYFLFNVREGCLFGEYCEEVGVFGLFW